MGGSRRGLPRKSLGLVNGKDPDITALCAQRAARHEGRSIVARDGLSAATRYGTNRYVTKKDIWATWVCTNSGPNPSPYERRPSGDTGIS